MSKTPKVEIRIIHPAEAAELLQRNSINRSMRKHLVERYAHDMSLGRWQLNGEPIVVNGDGSLMDGQHRLAACVEANTPFETLLINGISNEALLTLNTGQTRNLRDHLEFVDMPNSKTLAGALSWIFRYNQMLESEGGEQLGSGTKYSRQDHLAFLEQHPELHRSVEYAVENRLRIACPVTVIAFVHFLIAEVVDQDTATSFFEEVATGSGEAGSPAMKLREGYLNHQTRYNRPTVMVFAAMTIKAARFWLTGLSTERLIWKTQGRNKEPFPILDKRFVTWVGEARGKRRQITRS